MGGLQMMSIAGQGGSTGEVLLGGVGGGQAAAQSQAQLMQERETVIQQAVGGSVEDFPLPPDPDRFARNLHLTEIVKIDNAFYEIDENGEPDFDSINFGDTSDPHNVDVGGISPYPGLLPNPDGSDPQAV